MTTDLDFSETERALREGLATRARQVHPTNRLDAILHEASAPARVEPGRRGIALVAVAAAAAVVAGVVWAARPGTDDATLPAGRPSTSTNGSPAPGPATPTPTGTVRGPALTAALAVYWVGSNGGEADRPGLVRTFWSAPLDATEPVSMQVRAAVDEAMRRSESWRGTLVEEVEVTRDRVTLRLSGTGTAAVTRKSADLEVAALVWTAQAAVGRGDLPVRLTADGGGPLLGRVSSGATLTRAGTPPESLTDLWIDQPAPDAALRGGEPVTVTGQAVAFEAAVEWELRRGTTVLRQGFTTADAGAPRRGTFTVDLGRLEEGTWTFRAFTTSARDGQAVVAERLVTFTVGL